MIGPTRHGAPAEDTFTRLPARLSGPLPGGRQFGATVPACVMPSRTRSRTSPAAAPEAPRYTRCDAPGVLRPLAVRRPQSVTACRRVVALMARIKLVYIGGGSTRAPGTVAALIVRGAAFAGSEVVLVDLDLDHLAIVERLARRMADARGLDLRISSTTDRIAGLRDADVVLASFRPGGFEARVVDERLPLRHGVVGQETQGPGGFFMALRSIAVFRDLVADIERVAPTAVLINYTNPVNIVSEAITHHSAIPTISLCEGPIYFPPGMVRAADLDPARLDAVMVGLNHTGWTVRQLYDGADVMPLIEAAAERRGRQPSASSRTDRMLHLAATMGSLPSAYLYYYYFHGEALETARSTPTTRAEDIVAEVSDYWRHYE